MLLEFPEISSGALFTKAHHVQSWSSHFQPSSPGRPASITCHVCLGATEGSAGPPALTVAPRGTPLNTALHVPASTVALLSVPHPQPVLTGSFAS